MSNLNDLTALALPSGRSLEADETETRLSLSLEGQPLIRLRLSREPVEPDVDGDTGGGQRRDARDDSLGDCIGPDACGGASGQVI